MKSINYILGSDSVTVYLDGNSYTINRQAHTFPMVMRAISEGNLDDLRDAVNIRKKITNSLNKLSENVHIDDGRIFYGDREVTGIIVSRIFEIIELGLDVKPMINFIENLMKNPSKRAVDELFGFMDACSLPITSDGHFLAYKRVRADYKDCHSGTMDNSVGKVLEVPRNMVDEDKNNTCSHGLHFCSYDYLAHFGGARIMVLKINPADVVAIPADYNNSKGRTCRYEVVDELPLDEYKLPEVKITDSYEDRYDEDDEDFEEVDYSFETVVQSPKQVTGAKVTEDIVRDIRDELSNGYSTVAELARYYSISPRQVARIRDGLAWSWVK